MKNTPNPLDPLGRDGVVALEFAVIAPVLALMLVGAYDVAHSLFVWQQAVTAAEMVVNTANTLAQESESTTTYANLTPNQATLAMSVIYAVMPWLRNSSFGANYSVTLSAAEFLASENATTPGTTAYLAWTAPLTATGLSALDSANGASAPGSYLQSHPRYCTGNPATGSNQLAAVSQVPQDITTLQDAPVSNITTPGTLLIADVSYQYNPLFFKFITGSITFWATAVATPVAGSTNQPVDYDKANAPTSSYGTICTGYL